MPISIARAQQEALNELGGFTEDAPGSVRLGITEKVLAQFGAEFQQKLERRINERQVVNTGELESNITFIIVNGDTLQVSLPEYFDYPNKGVKGVKSSRNAPGSPYQYKTYGMSKEGRRSIREMIQRGKAKIANVRQDKALGIGTERKRLSAAESAENTLIYMIKKYGIKATKYFDDTVAEVFKDFDLIMSEAVAGDIVYTLQRRR